MPSTFRVATKEQRCLVEVDQTVILLSALVKELQWPSSDYYSITELESTTVRILMSLSQKDGPDLVNWDTRSF